MKVLLDTCVLIDFLQKREPFAADAKDVMLFAASNLMEGYTTAKAVTDIYYLVHRMTHSDAETRKIVSGLLSIIGVLDTVCADIQNALLSPVGDFEDAVMIETARRERADCIVTRNGKDYAKANIPVYSPQAFVQMMRDNME